ncbi:MAG: Na+/H+ antiporter NhaA [Gammaproteobacteria bacterium]|nr:Na+/H+ antiporter NhaA [Gammaproteobacteria bacterium]|tara:strand:- start:61671 stop:62855 length:1185 start_codon:yes stop_codon:yes gene_type:complete
MGQPSTIQDFLTNFFSKEEKTGILLLIFSIFALIIVNSPFQNNYYEIKNFVIPISIGDFDLSKPIEHWVNDGLMAIFFFVIGLELKREILEGELSSFSKMLSPGIAALGGMIAPALIYYFINHDYEQNLAGWAIPTATDIAFSLAVLLIIGSRVPTSLKIFLLSLAIIDDLGAVLIIALFYSSDLSMINLSYGLIVLSLLIFINFIGVTRMGIYILLGLLLWYFVLKSGIHATIAGVLLAATIPNHQEANGTSMLKNIENALHNYISILILPIFAFFNSDINLSSLSLNNFVNPISLGIILGLLVGKPIGITLFTYISIKLNICRLPKGLDLIDILGLSFLCGIGFTMSLFINSLAFSSTELLDLSKLGIFVGSILSAIIGYRILKNRNFSNEI